MSPFYTGINYYSGLLEQTRFCHFFCTQMHIIKDRRKGTLEDIAGRTKSAIQHQWKKIIEKVNNSTYNQAIKQVVLF